MCADYTMNEAIWYIESLMLSLTYTLEIHIRTYICSYSVFVDMAVYLI